MASQPVSAPANLTATPSNGTSATPPTSSSPPSPPPPPFPPATSPPPNSSPPSSPPPSSPSPPQPSTPPPTESPPAELPKTSSPSPTSPLPQSQSPPPPANQLSPLPQSQSPPPPPLLATLFPSSPPQPLVATTPPSVNSSLPAAPIIFPLPLPSTGPNQPVGIIIPSAPPPPHAAPTTSNHASAAGSPPLSSDHSSPNIGITIGIAVVGSGILVLLFAVIFLLLFKRKKRQPYYIDPPGLPPKGGEPYYNNSPNWNSPITPSPGMMTTPIGDPGAWGVPLPLPLAANTNSTDYTSNSGQHQQQQHLGQLSPGGGGGGGLGGFNKCQFSYEELAAATGGFCQVNLLGQGGFGFVHKGVLPDGRDVAVKSLKAGSGQGEREFQAEVEIISRVHHRHLVSLVGYCINGENQRMLVYEFVPNKTLEFHLHGKGQPVMEWATRFKIAMGSAKGLAYLHEDCHPRIIHRDIKAANILLDDNNEAMVADFGLAKLTSDTSTHVSTRVMGTFGYLAPEYASSGKLTEKSDVFSFGVMLLELITGRRPVDSTNMFMEDSLVDWARPRLAKAILEDVNNDHELVDSRLEGNYCREEMGRMISCAAACIRHSARRRPQMSQIVRALHGDSSVDFNDGPKLNANSSGIDEKPETQTYDTEMYNADMTKFKKMVMSSQEFGTSEYGETSEYGLNLSSSSSSSDEFPSSHQHNNKT